MTVVVTYCNTRLGLALITKCYLGWVWSGLKYFEARALVCLATCFSSVEWLVFLTSAEPASPHHIDVPRVGVSTHTIIHSFTHISVYPAPRPFNQPLPPPIIQLVRTSLQPRFRHSHVTLASLPLDSRIKTEFYLPHRRGDILSTSIFQHLRQTARHHHQQNVGELLSHAIHPN